MKCTPIKIYQLLLASFILCGLSQAVERDDKLSGTHEAIKQESLKTIGREPERVPAGEKQKRPTLKLPEVIVKGEKQYCVSAEKKELMEIDPMKGTKDVPADIVKVSIPGLADEKNAPQASTITSKDYLLRIESGVGTSRQALGALIAGYETELFNIILKAGYLSIAYPEVYNFLPYDQKAEITLNSGFNISKYWQLSLDIETETGAYKNPDINESLAAWVHNQDIQLGLINKIQLTNQTLISLYTTYGKYRLYGGKWRLANDDIRASTRYQGTVDLDLMVPFIKQNDLNVLVHGNIEGQKIEENYRLSGEMAMDETFSNISVHTRFQPFSMIAFDIGVKLDQLSQAGDITLDQNILAGIDMTFPWGATFYGRLDGGLKWIKANELIPNHHRVIWQDLTTGILLNPEKNNEHFNIGWRQKLNSQIVLDLSWSKKNMDNYLIWTNDLVDQLFAWQQINNVILEKFELNINITSLDSLNFEMAIGYNQSKWQGEKTLPYQPGLEAQAVVTWDQAPWTLALKYRYLGERPIKLSDQSQTLKSAHLLDVKANYAINKMLDVFIDLNNVLSYTWEKWSGYPENGVTILLGMRLTL